MKPLAQPPALVFFGSGPRRWRLLGDRPDSVARVLPADAVAERRVVPRPEADSVHNLLAWIDEQRARGLAVAAHIGHEAGVALQPKLPAGFQHFQQPQPSVPAACALSFEPASLQDLPLAALEPAAAQLDALAPQRDRFVANVLDALERIRAGEIYQVNLTTDVRRPAELPDDPLAYCAAIAGVQAIPFGFALCERDFAIVSGSMERFLSVTAGEVLARPIKGTAPRHADPDADVQARLQLVGSAKERAENLMIVDMMRNDLQRACQRGSVEVAALLQAVPYATLWHLESEIRGRLADPTRLQPLLEVTLPPASVTGCPKLQALEVIAEREQVARGPYCGVLGVATPDGHSDWSVAIRTLVFADGQVRAQVGAGIVADSDPEREWNELHWKARAPLAAWATATQQEVRHG